MGTFISAHKPQLPQQPPSESPRSFGSQQQSPRSNGATPAVEEDELPRPTLLSLRESLKFVLQQTAATDDQRVFLEQWMQLVFCPAYSSAQGPVGLVLSTDLTLMEVSVTAPREKSEDLVGKFLSTCGGQLDVIEHMKQVLDAAVCEDVVSWCRLKRMGSDDAAIDIGFEVQARVPWITADMMMPPVPDMEVLREHARQDMLEPCGYGCSLLPTEPERFLEFELSKTSSTSKNLLYVGLFFFKCMGFAKPEDRVIKGLANLMASRMGIRCSMGPKGLTCLSMMAINPVQGDPRSLVGALESECHESLHGLPKELKTTPRSIHFRAEEQGYTAAVGFQF